jgi:predicted dehydrogenase
MADSTQGGGQGASRRWFIKTAGAAGAAVAADWRSRKAFAAANAGVAGANDRIKIGHIGVGNMGMGHLTAMVGDVGKNNNAQVVAVCEVYEPRKTAAKEKVGADCKVYSDYRKLLEDKDVDAVLVATPEHWHYQMCADALEAKKPIYLEKPLTLHLDDATKLYDLWKTKHSDVVFQLGNQNASDPKWLYINENMLPKIGKLLWSQGSYTRNTVGGEWNTPIDKDFNPAHLDWKMFLGPAPQRELSTERFFRWRKFWD